MSNRLPPAWSKHLKAQTGPTIAPPKIVQPKTAQPKTAQPKAKPQPPAVNDDMLLRQALQFQQAKRLPEAEELCHRVLTRKPNHALALYILGTLGLGVDNELAIRYFARAADQEPNNPYYQLSLGEAYLKIGDYPPAIRHLQRACELKPDLVEALRGLGDAYGKFDKADIALSVYEKALGINRDHPTVRMGLASVLINLGRMDEATSYLKETIDRRVDVADAYQALVNIHKFSEEPPELKQILGEISNPAASDDQPYALHLAAGKILNDLGRYDEAMDHFLRAKAVKPHDDFEIELYRRRVDSIIRLFSAEFLTSAAKYGDPSETPVFVLGMPRSGTTLTEQICSSHPDVHGAGELTKLRRIAAASGLTKTSEEPFGKNLRSMTIQQSRTFAEDYLANLRLYAPSAARIIDKMPHNFEAIGLIAILFPNARIIHCRRDAVDNCLSLLFSNLNKNHAYISDLTCLGLYYREYDRLMRHWHTVLPGRILENRYEDLVSSQEGQSRRLIDHLGLEWDDACLRFFDKAGSVRTLSRWQVRQPIYGSSIKRWKNYEGRIRPLIEALGDLAEL
ncbi:tetratricopeptide repeat protein [Mesorhizobium sp. M7A.F.Ca.CA.001.09.2.1]|uniref:Sulfotransferase n=3 Tax=Mesorhizobium TaxID=68287 RepID=A0AB38T950_9HYPH|nr:MULTISPECIES: sulfotransferase [Mesorhizobium]RUY58357.1 tetratricopeptide repeat protein [Mesorhizobium sp. M7A.F.Ca.CA.001.13.2.1]MDF3216617.1 sulfotransferase [Mesorhizobium ciceri]RUY66286.1 tetratricopeptide repeat protein [Mesorhizobium sp. M7A.F.Ca.CA.001.05.1.1]RUY67403.1 tetratricopeptide repeat protein [Mesorhizobium sp. M7A.F.Ca.CA.001.13.1.1]RUY75837.1 tetratricopeptide repeat protein [Mesorhizobium sp. M7A.F.Ca.CA.001.09.2.1]